MVCLFYFQYYQSSGGGGGVARGVGREGAIEGLGRPNLLFPLGASHEVLATW